MFCAEPPPDTATALKIQVLASLDAKAKAETAKIDVAAKGEIQDKLEKAVVVLAERTATLDMFRTGVYALCQYYLNGAMTGEQVGKAFGELIEA